MLTKHKVKILLLALLLVLPASLVSASTTQNKITIDPSVIKIEARQGETIMGSFIYSNGTPRTQELDFTISPFVEEEGSKQPVFYTNNGSEIKSPSKDWIEIVSPPKQVFAGQEVKIVFTIKVPKKADLGIYRDAIFVNSSSVSNISTSANLINYRMGALVFLDVKEGRPSLIMEAVTSPILYLLLVIMIVLAILIRINKKRTCLRKRTDMTNEPKDEKTKKPKPKQTSKTTKK